MSNAYDRPTFRSLSEATVQDMSAIFDHYHGLRNGIADQVLMMLKLLAGERLGFPVDRLEHSMQSAALALRDGADEETVVCALLHDIGDNIAPDNHGAFAAEILRPWVSAENYWVVRNHNDFVGRHYFEKIGRDPDIRERHRGHPAFEKACTFCDAWDAVAFDPNFNTPPLEFFEPMVRRVFSGEHWANAEKSVPGH